MVSEGDLLADKYRVERLLGEGGMGHVYAATHERLGVRVAVKILSSALSQNEDAVRRFSREARASVRIQSEHVARVLDVGNLESGEPFMVMEHLSGDDLAQVLKERGRLPIHESIHYVLQACEAVAEAHALGVIHRDLKPANLFLTRRPDGSPLVKVLDFGIAKAIVTEKGASAGASAGSASLTRTHSFLGSPAYMSPEQVRAAKSVDSRSDIWSLGTIVYELLVGDIPFRGSNALDLLAAVASDPMPSIREKRSDVSPELEAVIARCLEKKPGDRYQTVAEFAEALGPHAPPASQGHVSRISGIQRAMAEPAPRGASEAASPERASRPGEKRTVTNFGHSQSFGTGPRSRLLVAAGVAVLSFVIVFWWLGSRRGAPGDEASSAEPREPLPASEPNALPLGAGETAEIPPIAVPSSAPLVPASAVKSASPPSLLPKTSPKSPPLVASGRRAAASPLSPGPSSKPAPSVSDPLDGRR